MRRREFITLVTVWPFAARAQQSALGAPGLTVPSPTAGGGQTTISSLTIGAGGSKWRYSGAAHRTKQFQHHVYDVCAQEGQSLTTLLKSVDKGNTWQMTGFPFWVGSAQDPYRCATGQRIAINLNDPNIVYASTTANLYVSLNPGLLLPGDELSCVPGYC